MLLGRGGDESVGRLAREIHQPPVSPRLVRLPGVAGHHVGVHIDGVNGVADGDFVFVAENIKDVAAIALGAVTDKNFVVGHFQPLVAEIVLGDGVAQPIIALFRAVALEALSRAHFIHRPVHGGHHGRGQWLGHIADAAADQPFGGIRMGIAERLHPAPDFREQVAGLEFQVIVVEQCHKRMIG